MELGPLAKFVVFSPLLSEPLHQPPGGLAVQVPPRQPQAVRAQRPEEEAFPVILDAGLRHVSQNWPSLSEGTLL